MPKKRQKLENLIKKKTEVHGFNYFEYSKLISPRKYKNGIAKKANIYDDKKVLLKGFIDENSKIDIIDNLVEELKLFRIVHPCPNMNHFLGITKDGGNYTMVLEYANEGNLRDYLKKKFKSLEWKNKIKMAFDITCGLKYLHSNHIIHRNLHSNNILVNNGKALITDFGSFRQLKEDTSNSVDNSMRIGYIEPQNLKDPKYKMKNPIFIV